MEDPKVTIEFSVVELEILINAVGTASPANKEREVIQFKLYHKLLFRLNETRK